jgi:cysteine peptidase B
MTEKAAPYTFSEPTNFNTSCPSSWPAPLFAPLDYQKPYTCLTKHDGAPVNEDKLATWIATQGPVVTAIDVSALIFYTGGIIIPNSNNITMCTDTELGHVVSIVGFNDDHDPPYWICRNSYGPQSGENGYFRILKGVGACGMTSAVLAMNLKGNPPPKITCPPA